MYNLPEIKSLYLKSQNYFTFNEETYLNFPDKVKNILKTNSINKIIYDNEIEFEFHIDNYKSIIKELSDFDIYYSEYLIDKSGIMKFTES